MTAPLDGRTVGNLETMVRIVESAGDRSLTRAQLDDFEAAKAGFDAATANARTGYAYMDSLISNARNATDPVDVARYAAEIRSTNRGFDSIMGAAKLRAQMAGGEGSHSWSTGDLGEMWAQVKETGFVARDISRSEGFAGTLETRALQSQGGSAIPETFADFVTVYMRTMTPTLNPEVTRIIDTPTGAPIILPRLTADPSAASTVTAEAAGITEADATVSSVTLESYGYKVMSLWSRELDTDNRIGLEDLIGSSVARQIVISGAGSHLTTGDGSGKPNGFINAATNGGTANGTANAQATDTFVSYFDLVDFFHTFAAPYREVGAWQVSNTALARLWKMRDADGRPLLGTNMAGRPTLLGRPVYENPAMAALASASKSFAFGDFQRYVVRRLPLRVELSLDYKFGSDQVALRAVERLDGDLLDADAVKYLVSANT